ncbi:MAG: hypothetical protein ACXAC8_09990 [Candidatus Hodarchaeales archaeon]
MPFISITFGEASHVLKDTSLITQLVKEKRINPREADLLDLLCRYARNRNPEMLTEIKDFCDKYFGDEGDKAFQRLSRFVKSENKRVSWVIFSRTFQRIEFDERNPLEDYTPRLSEVLTITSKYRLVK